MLVYLICDNTQKVKKNTYFNWTTKHVQFFWTPPPPPLKQQIDKYDAWKLVTYPVSVIDSVFKDSSFFHVWDKVMYVC